MDLTDEDLEHMASVMWRELSPPALPSSADGGGSSRGKEKNVVNVSPTPAPNADMVGQSDQKKRVATKAADWSQNTNSSNARARKRTSKKTASLFAELEVSSPVISTRAKDHKLNKSMKGASQNESQLAKKAKQAKINETLADEEPTPAPGQDADVYSFPISPTSSGRVKKSKMETKKSPQGIAKMKMSSPLASGIQTHLDSLHEKFSKPQKRVAKRSFLDPPETPQPQKAVKLQKSKKLPPTQKPQATTQTKRQTEQPAPAQKDLASAQPAGDNSIPKANATSKLRPRRERAPIVISSDPVSSGAEDGGFEFLDMDYVLDTDCSSLHSAGGRTQLPEKQRASPQESAAGTNQSKVHQTPVATAATSKTPEVTVRDSTKAEKPPSMRKAVAHATDSTNKRRVAPGDTSKADRHEKKTRLNPDREDVKARVQAKDETRSGTNPRKKIPASVRPAAVNDPFTADEQDMDSTQTQFTAKLLKSAGMGGQSENAAAKATPNVQPKAPQHGVLRSESNGQQAHQEEQVQQAKQDQREKTDVIAKQMMRLFADLDTVAAEGIGQQQAEKALWLGETEAYGETGQIMGYVCKTILRFLKSKEAAIEDVANEYHQRGAIVLARVESLHKTERHKLMQQYEQSRLDSLGVFDAACSDVQQLMGKLQKVRVAPVVNSVFADTAASRLRALQAEVA